MPFTDAELAILRYGDLVAAMPEPSRFKRRGGCRPLPLTAEQFAATRRLLGTGLGLKRIAPLVGVSYGRLKREMDRAGAGQGVPA